MIRGIHADEQVLECPSKANIRHPKQLTGMSGKRLGAEGRADFDRQGHFSLDPDSQPGKPVFNRTVALRDSWAKIQAKGKAKG
jgi:hypothetical protein